METYCFSKENIHDLPFSYYQIQKEVLSKEEMQLKLKTEYKNKLKEVGEAD